jgi:hypothetical protein
MTVNKLSHLTKGVIPHIPARMKTMHYLRHYQLPVGWNTTYACFVAAERPHKMETK